MKYQLDAIELSKAVKERLVDFALDDCFVNDPQLTSICKIMWSGQPTADDNDDGCLVSDLWVEGAFPAQNSESTLNTLAIERKFNTELSRHLDENKAVPRDRLLYQHQYKAILAAQEVFPNQTKPALVITAGTGSGKTESFLLPILNDLFNQHASKLDSQGIKCLILYPMNALVNDQVERLYEWLKGQKKLTLFHFTSETPEDKYSANQQGIEKYDTCRMRTRQQARGKEDEHGNKTENGRIPDILITNYSMLEYMLCRPQDAVFFGKSLQAIVLDEAHLYTGTLAAEIALLLRRLYQRCAVDPNRILHIATSATMGTQYIDKLRDFTATLFTKSASLVKVISGTQMRVSFPKAAPPQQSPDVQLIAKCQWLNAATLEYEIEKGFVLLAKNEQQCESLRNELHHLVDSTKIMDTSLVEPAKLLYGTLQYSPLIQQIEDILWQKKYLTLTKLSESLWQQSDEDSLKATRLLLQMGAAARKTAQDYPLLPHRIHLLTRSVNGLTVCLNSNCNGKPELKLDSLGCVSANYHEKCPHCQSAMLSIYRCDNCGEWILAGMERNFQLSPVFPLIFSNAENQSTKIRYFTLNNKEYPLSAYSIHRQTGEIKGQRQYPDFLTVYDLQIKRDKSWQCRNCDEKGTQNTKPFKPFTISNITLSVIVETTLSQLPVLPSKQSNEYLPAHGRRMLLFSDSRREAAKLGPTLTRQHEIQLIRSAIVEGVQRELAADPSLIADHRDEIGRLETTLQTQLTPAQRQSKEKRLAQVQKELNDALAGGSLEDWAKALKRSETIKQLFHFESAKNHKAERWYGEDNRRPLWEQNSERIQEELAFLLKQELATYFIGSASPEAFGLVEITFPGLNELAIPNDYSGKLPSDEIRKNLSKCWVDLLRAVCDFLRNDKCLTMEDGKDNEYQFNQLPVGRWCSLRDTGNFLNRFLPKQERSRRYQFAQQVLKKCGVLHPSKQQIDNLLEALFNQLLENAGTTLTWLERGERLSFDKIDKESIRIKLPRLGLRRPQQLYLCSVTHRVFSYSVMGFAVGSSVKKQLLPVNDSELDNDPRIGRQRREFKDSPVFKMALWAEEHSAQLSPQENKRLQNLFKSGMRNILSSTTTLELGIDIGGLHAVLMGNVPPSKANYLQRAGRAGRRADGSSIVITYCRSSPFDREVFSYFDKYLAKELRTPNIFLDRKRILKRHAHAFLLGEFFRTIYSSNDKTGAMAAFGKMGKFCGVPLPPKWDGGDKPTLSEEPPESLRERFLEFLREETFEKEVFKLFDDNQSLQDSFDWSDFSGKTAGKFEMAIKSWEDNYQTLLQNWKESGMQRQANAIRYQLLALYELTVIEALAEEQFLPRYGFPIGTMKLSVFEYDEHKKRAVEREDQYRLERSGLLALGEYVPGSQLLAGGKLITSHGLLKHWTGADIDTVPNLRGWYATCENKHFYYEVAKKPEQCPKCPICGEDSEASPQSFLIPKHGFKTAAWDKPKRSSDIERVGSVKRGTVTFVKNSEETEGKEDNFAGISKLHAHYKENGELLVYNEGDNRLGFAICLKCGYTDSENETDKLPKGFEEHAALDEQRGDRKCWKQRESVVLRHQTLAAKQTTDILLLDFGYILQEQSEEDRPVIVETFAQALKIAGAKLLQLDSRELGALVMGTKHGWGVVIYDNVPGGAGHVLELFNLGREWLDETLQQMYISEEHHQHCETACLDCLLTFDSQNNDNFGQLQRKTSHEILYARLHSQIQ